jgi:hypothetical protein
MDSLDAQCLLIQLAEGDIPPPDVWRHDRSGALSCGYERGELVFTWPAEDVAEMARTWRNSDTSRAPEQARLCLDAHQRLEALAKEAGLGPAEVIIHHLGRAEISGRWEDEEIVLTWPHGPRSHRSRRLHPHPHPGCAGRKLAAADPTTGSSPQITEHQAAPANGSYSSTTSITW